MTVRLEVIFWRDIPAQIIAREGRNVHRVELPNRFQEAIDRAATRAGVTATDDYLTQWRKKRTEAAGEPADLARTAADETEMRFTDDLLAAYVTNAGWKP